MELAQSKMQHSDTDRPLDDPEADELGFVETAAKLAPAVLRLLDTDGVVIGIEGEWGSGKTTLTNYLLKEVKRLDDNPIEVIYLSPWLSGDSDTLVGSLLQALAATIEDKYIDDKLNENEQRLSWKSLRHRWFLRGKRWFRKKKQTPLTQLLSKYALKTARTATPILSATDVLIPGTGIAAGKILDASTNTFSNLTESPTTATLKGQISNYLKKVDCRFIVFIDDLDRLEPSMAVEVVRLVRSVADFPKVLYVMCYDRAILAHALEVGLNVEDGYRFLRKIVQQTFSIPLPESFDLRLSLVEKAISFFYQHHHRTATEQESQEIRSAINVWGYGLRTPRDVKLVMNAIVFAYPPVAENVYYPDVCRLHLIKVIHPQAYEWLESYLTEHSVLVTGDGCVGKYESTLIAEKLLELFPDADDPQSPRSPWHIQDLVLGVNIRAQVEPHELVFQGFQERDLSILSENKRLGSPYHYRYYFALSSPRTVFSDAEFQTLLLAANESVESTHQALIELYTRPRRLGGNWLSQMFDRFNKSFINSLNIQQLASLLLSVAAIMEDTLHSEEIGFPFRRRLSDQARTLIRHLYREWQNRDQESADRAVIDLVTTTSSINWLVGMFFRSELFDHGLVDPNRVRPEEQWLMPADVFERTIEIVKERAAQYAEQTALDQFPDLASFIFGWRDLSGSEVVREWVSRKTVESDGFVDFLCLMRSWAVSDRLYRPLHLKSLNDLMDVELIQSRLGTILESETNPQTLDRAREVLEALKLGDEF